MLLPPLRFETPRVLLQKPRAEDAQRVFSAYAQDSDVCRFLVWHPHKNLEETEAFIRRCTLSWQEASAFPYVMTSPDTGNLLGMLEIRVRSHALDFGYVLAHSHWGKGIMVEALRPILDWAFAQPSIFRVWAVCDSQNTRSARVLEKLGLQREGLLKRWLVHPNVSSEPRDCYCYASVR